MNLAANQASIPGIEDTGEKVVREIIIAIIDRSELFKAGVRQKLSTQRDFRLMDSDPDREPLQYIDANSIDVVQLLGTVMDQSGLSKIESGQRPVSDIEVVALAKALKVSVEWLLEGTDASSIL